MSGRLTVLAAWQVVAPYSSRRHPSSFIVEAYYQYASLLRISGALHLSIFEQPQKWLLQQLIDLIFLRGLSEFCIIVFKLELVEAAILALPCHQYVVVPFLHEFAR